ncbi:MAG TPA: M36 family metallopeptidase, partial [Flavobacteriales bacterium]|nr:M36 family metallopeptidase [Flavobacteriales bacterium]
FVDGRNAILQADVINNGGANQNIIWAAFARRGLGASASQGSTNSRTDQVEAFDTPLPANVGVAALLSPATSAFDCPSTNVPVSVTVRNYGQNAQSNFPVTYQLDGGAVVTETFTGTLATNSSATFTFAQTIASIPAGTHNLVVSTVLSGDQYTGNDASTSSLAIATPTTLTPTYLENVEATSPTPTGWALQNPDNNNTWVTAALSGQSACVGTRAWAIDNYSVNTPGQEDRLVSPVFNLSASAGTHLKFQHAYSGYSSSYLDGLRAEISSDCGKTWTTLYSAAGDALRTVAFNTAAWTPSSCADWLQHDINISAYDGQQVMFRFTAINQFGNWLYLDNVLVENNGVKVAAKLYLEGPYDVATHMMNDNLRAAGQVPTTEPYTGLGFPQAGNGGNETISASVLAVTGNNAIVDWVQLQLRSSANPSTILATRNVLVQRDGDVVDKDGTSPVSFLAAAGNYYVAARHRNHLGAMTLGTVALSATSTAVDFSTMATYGTEAERALDSRNVLWAGNVVIDNNLQYVGNGNDRDPILSAIGGSVPTNTTGPGYFITDVNMDGMVLYVGSGNDRDPILSNIGGAVPTNLRVQQLP